MLNTYRIISLSLVTALFFAAPLLCIQPISFQIKKAQNTQHERVRVVAHRVIHNPQFNRRNVSAAVARSIHRPSHKTLHMEAPVPVGVADEVFNENYRSGWDGDGEPEGIGGVRTTSYSDL